MDLLSTFAEYAIDNDMGERAVFDAAMEKRIQKEGYRISDMCFDIYKAQRDIAILERELQALRDQLEAKPKPKAPNAKSPSSGAKR